ncbi:hypothetical protein BPS26883_02545 [Burkholderia pseudomultivorans]|uniref:Uncharacterized protein n=1 Tax=Burkholderia pseudomultivorans TaxID=1207504 RepID=A0A6P2KG64_9BURK|nr:hypothetical protein BPS26883_02545 [Burkholderia pseudomultivorans]
MSVVERGGERETPPQWGTPAPAATRGRAPSRHSSGGSTIACAASFWRTRNAARRFA